MFAPAEPAFGFDRRESHRFQYYVAVQLRRGSSTLWGQTTQIGLDGMFVELGTPPPPGTLLRALVPLINGESIWVTCEVRRVLPGAGMAVEFTEISQEAQGSLRDLLERLPH